MKELWKPEWRNTKALFRSINKNSIKSSIIRDIARNYEEAPHDKVLKKHKTAEAEVKYFFPTLIGNIRYLDIADSKYWLIVLIGILLFLMAEVIVFIVYREPISHTLFDVTLILGSLFLVIVIIVVFLVSIVFQTFSGKVELNVGPRVRGKSSGMNLIVLTTGIIFLLINLYLVMKSNGSDSPFMPALVYISFAILSAPRENSRTVIILTVLSLLVLIYLNIDSPQVQNIFVDQRIEVSPELKKLANAINVVTLIFTSIMLLVLRSQTSKIETLNNNQ